MRRKKKAKKRPSLRGNRRGVTLVEMIVSFALIGIFMVSAAQVISATMRIYTTTRDLDQAIQVQDTLLDKIAGELESAQAGNGKEEGDTVTLKIEASRKKVSLFDRTGCPIYITLDEDGTYLLIHYDQIVFEQEGESVILSEAVDWKFDKGMYMGMKIQDLTFSRPRGAYPDNVIKIELTLTRGAEGYSASRYVQCGNFTPDDYGKISG